MVPVPREATYAPRNNSVEATPVLERKDALLVWTAVVTLTEDDPGYKYPQPHLHTWLVCSCGELQGVDLTSGGEHKTGATRTNTSPEQPFRGVWTRSQSVVPRTDRNRLKTMVPNSGDVWLSNQIEKDIETHLRGDHHPLRQKTVEADRNRWTKKRIIVNV